MAGDYRVKARSDSEVRALAKKIREFFGISNAEYVDVVACLKRPRIWTVAGERRLNFQARPDSELGADDGSTTYGKGVVTVAIKLSVHDEAILGVGRPRNTFAHELGHAVMHDGPPMSRRASGNMTPNWLRPFESAEHQAKVFAPAFLINDAIADTLSDAETISITFGISLESAKIYYEQLIERRNREKTAENIRRMAEEFHARTAPAPFKPIFYSSCGETAQKPA
jgi:IrrE N-terminal-like domain